MLRFQDAADSSRTLAKWGVPSKDVDLLLAAAERPTRTPLVSGDSGESGDCTPLLFTSQDTDQYVALVASIYIRSIPLPRPP